MLRTALRATALRAALDPGDPCGPWEQEKRAGPSLPRPDTGARRPARPGHDHYNRSLHGLRGTPISGLVYEEAPDATPGLDDVLVKVAACGITHNELDWPIWTCRAGHRRLLAPGCGQALITQRHLASSVACEPSADSALKDWAAGWQDVFTSTCPSSRDRPVTA